MKTKTGAIIVILFLLVLAITGCLNFLNSESKTKTYVSYPTRAQYTISYGYKISSSGNGEFNILYDCDTPEVLVGEVTITEHNPNFENIILVNNPMKRWNITGQDTEYYELGITANVYAESFIVEDLTGNNALTIDEIKNQHSDIYNKYTKAQSNDTIIFIDPDNSVIKNTAENRLAQTGSNNSFLVAKNLFIWLKENTDYKKHGNKENAQPASKTFNIKTGDCDDLSFLYISLCRSIGIPSRFIRGFVVEEDDNGYISSVPHAWAEVFVGGNIGNNGWIPVECACSSDSMDIQINQNFGIETVGHLRLFVDDGSNKSLIISFSDIKIRYDTKNNITLTPISNILDYKVLEKKELSVKNNIRKYQ